MGKLVYETALHKGESGALESYWPDYISVDQLLATKTRQGSVYFNASYQNDPSGLEGNILKGAWLHPYLPEEILAYRDEHGPGATFVGVDPTFGGEGTNPDFMAMGSIELLGNRAFLTDFFVRRVGVKGQAVLIDNWLELQNPHLTALEEIATKGYVYTDLTEDVHENKGTRFSIEVVKPGRVAKAQRFLQMAARFESAQIRIPGILTPEGDVVVDPRWDPFCEQWRSFPSGHDDILDAVYWASFIAFRGTVAGGSMRDPGEPRKPKAEDDTPTEPYVPVDRRGRPVRSIGSHRTRLSLGRVRQ